MIPTVRPVAAAVLAALAWWPGTGLAQGVIVPSPGSSSAATGPNALNPSAAASETRNPNALNPSAAPSAVSSPNALNPSATPSTFAPSISAPNALTTPRRPGVAVRPPPRAIARVRRGRAPARAEARSAPSRTAAPSRAVEIARASERRARSIVGSVCRGC